MMPAAIVIMSQEAHKPVEALLKILHGHLPQEAKNRVYDVMIAEIDKIKKETEEQEDD
jgi:hypothetical protein